jgi:hypothetical protein
VADVPDWHLEGDWCNIWGGETKATMGIYIDASSPT